MKADRYTPIPSWAISVEEFIRLLNRHHRADQRQTQTLDLISKEAPWFDPEGLEPGSLPSTSNTLPIFRSEDSQTE